MFLVSETPPAAADIIAAREQAGLSKEQAARLVWVGWRMWYRYERSESDMAVGLWELFLIKSRLPYRVERSE